MRAEATGKFREIAGAHGICPEVHYPVPQFASLAGGDWVNCLPRALAALRVKHSFSWPQRAQIGGLWGRAKNFFKKCFLEIKMPYKKMQTT